MINNSATFENRKLSVMQNVVGLEEQGSFGIGSRGGFQMGWLTENGSVLMLVPLFNPYSIRNAQDTVWLGGHSYVRTEL